MASKRALWPLVILLLIIASLLAQRNGALLTVRSTAVDILAPLRETVGALTVAGADLLGALKEAQTLDLDNQKLRRTVEELRRQNVELWETVGQQQRTLELLGYQKANPGWDYLSAKVIAWDPSNIIRTAAIDKGRRDGVEPGMVVVSPGGLVGKVMEAAEQWSRVLLITDPRSSVNGILQGAEARPRGVLQGRPDGLLQIKYLPPESPVRKGEAVVTSGLGGGFPSGLFVGWVSEVDNSDGQMFQIALVRPATDFDELFGVMVITNFMPISLE